MRGVYLCSANFRKEEKTDSFRFNVDDLINRSDVWRPTSELCDMQKGRKKNRAL